jgi:hypothetical protein
VFIDRRIADFRVQDVRWATEEGLNRLFKLPSAQACEKELALAPNVSI